MHKFEFPAIQFHIREKSLIQYVNPITICKYLLLDESAISKILFFQNSKTAAFYRGSTAWRCSQIHKIRIRVMSVGCPRAPFGCLFLKALCGY